MKSFLIAIVCMAVISAASEPIPVFFDSRAKWASCMGTPRSQGNCTSSWAHAFAGMVSDRLCIQKQQKVALSAQSLISCSTASKNCDGRFDLDEVKALLTGKGLVPESCLGYKEKADVECPSKCENEEPIVWHTCKSVAQLDTEDAIKAEVLNNGPVVCIGDVHADFNDYYSGVYYYASQKKAAVKDAFKIIGWGWENGIFYWTVETARGSGFGENGFARVKLSRDKAVKMTCESAVVCHLD